MISEKFIAAFDSSKEAIRKDLNIGISSMYKGFLSLKVDLGEENLGIIRSFAQLYLEREVTLSEVVNNKIKVRSGDARLTTAICRAAARQGIPVNAPVVQTADGYITLQAVFAKMYDIKTDYFLSTSYLDMLQPSNSREDVNDKAFTSCFADGGCNAGSVPVWCMTPGMAILFAEKNGKKTSRAWFYIKPGKGFLVFRIYGSNLNLASLAELFSHDFMGAEISGQKPLSVSRNNGLWIDPFTAFGVNGTSPEDVVQAFKDEIFSVPYVCPLCGKESMIIPHTGSMACCQPAGSTKAAVDKAKEALLKEVA